MGEPLTLGGLKVVPDEQILRNLAGSLICSAVFLSGLLACFTSGVVYESGKGNSALEWVTAIQTAKSSGDELFLTINARRPTDAPPEWQTLIVRTRLSELENIAPESLAPLNATTHTPPTRPKVRVKTASSIPGDAIPVPVVPVTLEDVSELPDYVNQLPNEIHVLLVSIRPSEQLKGHLPSQGIAHPWLLLTPLTVAADVVTFPIQLLAIFAIDC